MTAVCQTCQAPFRDGLICPTCSRKLEQWLAETPARITDLRVTQTRQDRVVHATAGNRPAAVVEVEDWAPKITLKSTPNPVGWRAVEVEREVARTLYGWVVALGFVPGTVERNAVTLTGNIRDVLAHEQVADLYHAMWRFTQQADLATDAQPGNVFGGRCTAMTVTVSGQTITVNPSATCGGDVWAKPEASEGYCVRCGTVYDMAESRRRMTDALRDQWRTPPVIASALSALGHEISLERLENWIARDKATHKAGRLRRDGLALILQVGIDDDRRPLYVVGDVLARLEAKTEKVTA